MGQVLFKVVGLDFAIFTKNSSPASYIKFDVLCQG